MLINRCEFSIADIRDLLIHTMRFLFRLRLRIGVAIKWHSVNEASAGPTHVQGKYISNTTQIKSYTQQRSLSHSSIKFEVSQKDLLMRSQSEARGRLIDKQDTNALKYTPL